MDDDHPTDSVGGVPSIVIGPGADGSGGPTYRVKIGDEVIAKYALYEADKDAVGTVISWGREVVYLSTKRGNQCFYATSLIPVSEKGAQSPTGAPLASSLPALDFLSTEVVELVRQRHAKYGASNLANSPGGMQFGIAVRLHDKLARIANGNLDYADESYRDTLLDIAGYALCALLDVDGNWPRG